MYNKSTLSILGLYLKKRSASAAQALLFLCLCCFVSPSLSARQQLPVNRVLTPVKTDSAYFLDYWVMEETLTLKEPAGQFVPGSRFEFDSAKGTLTLKKEAGSYFSAFDSLLVSFQVRPVGLSRYFPEPELSRYTPLAVGSETDSLAEAILTQQTQNIFSETDLRQSGSLSRGIVVGTNQDFAMESGLNFELSGQLTEELSIEAALTDRNIPIQPDGTTQNLREFDKVLIRLKSKSADLQMGDIDVSLTNSAFAKLNRRLQGGAGYYTTETGQFGGAASVVRGVYKRMEFAGQDGVQGPYRLQGNDNEQFVTVLAGTERVYINGRQVQRGVENEYIIDYGLGEVTFTNNLLIKDETRIIIEYEYLNQNFSQTLVAAEAEDSFLNGNFTVGATVIRQADGNDLLSQQTLTEADIEVLKNAGDNPELAVVSGAEPAGESGRNNTMRYALRDTLLNGVPHEIYVNDPAAGDAIYTVRFSNVGKGQGSYVRAGSSINGITYKWAGPGLGDYEPFRKLPAPQLHQMAAVRANYKLTKNIAAFGEWAVSDFDKNRFSPLDNSDNIDYAYTGGVSLDGISLPRGALAASFSRKYTGKNFNYFEHTKDIEFGRKWNLDDELPSKEVINEAEALFEFAESSLIRAEAGTMERAEANSRREGAELKLGRAGGLELNYTQDWVSTEYKYDDRQESWFRQNAAVSKLFSAGELQITPYIYGGHEKKTDRDTRADSLFNTSFTFYDAGPGLALAAEKWQADYSLGYRTEAGAQQNAFRKESNAVSHKLDFNFTPGAWLSNNNRVQWRTKTEQNRIPGTEEPAKRSLMIHSSTAFATKSDNWSGELLYEANTKREAMYQETYIEAGPELGQYVWEDLNGDGIQQIDEFFPELSPNEGTFIRQLLPSDELFRVIDLNVRLRNELKPFGFTGGETKISRFLRQVVLKSGIIIRENSNTDKFSDVYLLRLGTFQNDSTTLHGSLMLDNELALLPQYDAADLTLRYNKTSSTDRRSSELSRKTIESASVDAALKLTETTGIFLSVHKNTNSSRSTTLNSRNFEIRSWSVEPGINSTMNRSWRTGLKFSYTIKQDAHPAAPVNAKLFKIRTDNRFFLFRKIQANTMLEFRNIMVNSAGTGLALFELTEGTGKGAGLLWNINGSYRVNDLIRLNLSYDGRKTGNRPAVNTFKIIVNAIF